MKVSELKAAIGSKPTLILEKGHSIKGTKRPFLLLIKGAPLTWANERPCRFRSPEAAAAFCKQHRVELAE